MFSIVRTIQPIFTHTQSYIIFRSCCFYFFISFVDSNLIPHSLRPLATTTATLRLNHISLNSFDTCSTKMVCVYVCVCAMRLSYGLFFFFTVSTTTISHTNGPNKTNFYFLKWVKIKEAPKYFNFNSCSRIVVYVCLCMYVSACHKTETRSLPRKKCIHKKNHTTNKNKRVTAPLPLPKIKWRYEQKVNTKWWW